MSSSPLNHNSTPSKEQPDVQFTTKNIGRWASRQENPFAEQNRKAAAKKQQQAVQRRKVAPIFIIIGSILAVGLAVFGLVMLIINLVNGQPQRDIPVISGSTAQDVGDYRDALQKFYNQGTSNVQDVKVDEIDKTVQDSLDKADSQEQVDAIKLGQMIFFVNNNLYEQAWKVAQEINPDNLDLEKQRLYYSSLYFYALGIGDQTLANEYNWKNYEISLEIGGQGGA